MKYHRKCVACGKEFATNHQSKEVCSDECAVIRNRRKANRTITDICAICGQPYSKPVFSRRQTCGGECKRELSRAKQTKTQYMQPRERKPSGVAEKEAKARAKGLSYGQLQAQRFLEQNRVQIEPVKKRFIIYD